MLFQLGTVCVHGKGAIITKQVFFPRFPAGHLRMDGMGNGIWTTQPCLGIFIHVERCLFPSGTTAAVIIANNASIFIQFGGY